MLLKLKVWLDQRRKEIHQEDKEQGLGYVLVHYHMGYKSLEELVAEVTKYKKDGIIDGFYAGMKKGIDIIRRNNRK